MAGSPSLARSLTLHNRRLLGNLTLNSLDASHHAREPIRRCVGHAAALLNDVQCEDILHDSLRSENAGAGALCGH